MQDTRIRVRAYRRVGRCVSFFRISGTLSSRSLAPCAFGSSAVDHVQCDPGDSCDRHRDLYRRDRSSLVGGSTQRFRECRSRGPLDHPRIYRPCSKIGSLGARTGVPTNGWRGKEPSRRVDWTGFVMHRPRGRAGGCRVVVFRGRAWASSHRSCPLPPFVRWNGCVVWCTIEQWHGWSFVFPSFLPACGTIPSFRFRIVSYYHPTNPSPMRRHS
mmetsp:Transcript_9302/g.56653  ORF Transcript_9302/g.56653 Transcript_9302/m.56653 type:complete len:214 (-) Transcript_9302:2713-3354(-)